MAESALDALLRRIVPRRGGMFYDFECDIDRDGSVAFYNVCIGQRPDGGSEDFYSWRVHWTTDDGRRMFAWMLPKGGVEFEGYPPPLMKEEVLAAFKAYIARGSELENR